MTWPTAEVLLSICFRLAWTVMLCDVAPFISLLLSVLSLSMAIRRPTPAAIGANNFRPTSNQCEGG